VRVGSSLWPVSRAQGSSVPSPHTCTRTVWGLSLRSLCDGGSDWSPSVFAEAPGLDPRTFHRVVCTCTCSRRAAVRGVSVALAAALRPVRPRARVAVLGRALVAVAVIVSVAATSVLGRCCASTPPPWWSAGDGWWERKKEDVESSESALFGSRLRSQVELCEGSGDDEGVVVIENANSLPRGHRLPRGRFLTFP